MKEGEGGGKKKHDEEQIAEIFLFWRRVIFGRVYLAAADGGEGRVSVPIQFWRCKKGQSFHERTVSSANENDIGRHASAE